MHISLEIYIKGRVQGVGYRAYAVKTAEKRDIKGYVSNLADGRVKVVAKGGETDMQKFLKDLKRGPISSLVQDIQSSELNSSERYEDFVVKY